MEGEGVDPNKVNADGCVLVENPGTYFAGRGQHGDVTLTNGIMQQAEGLGEQLGLHGLGFDLRAALEVRLHPDHGGDARDQRQRRRRQRRYAG